MPGKGGPMIAVCRLCKELLTGVAPVSVRPHDMPTVQFFSLAAATEQHTRQRHPEIAGTVAQILGMAGAVLYAAMLEAPAAGQIAEERAKALAAAVDALRTFEVVRKPPADLQPPAAIRAAK